MRNLMVALDDEGLVESLIPAVVKMAQDLGLGSIAFVAGGQVALPASASAIGLPFGLMAANENEVRRRLTLLAAQSKMAANRLRSTWRSDTVDDPTRFVLLQVDRADLLVAPQPRRPAPGFGAIDLARLILRAGRPVLVAPRAQAALPMTRILVAWNDTREARLAVASAMPLLLQAERVLIVGVGADSQSERLQQVADYCGLHGVYAQTKVENDVRTGDEGQALLDAADDDASTLIVSGAYGHSRLRELVLGRVTRDLLQQETRPCLFSH